MSSARYETHRIAGAGGAELAVDVWPLSHGSAPARPGYLLVHGLASNARLYDGVAERLAAAGHAAAAVDLRGHGRSAKPDDGYDYDTMCADLAEVLGELAGWTGAGFERPVVVGQSYGANLVLELATRYGELIAGVACIDGGTIDLPGRFSSWEEARTVLEPPTIEGTPAEELRRMLGSRHADWPPAGLEGALANFEVRADGTVAPWLTREHHLAILRSMWDSRPPALYPAVPVPVLLMPAGSPDAPAKWARTKRAGVENALAALPRAEVHWFTPADHDVHAQHPDEVADVLLQAGQTLFSTGRRSTEGTAR